MWLVKNCPNFYVMPSMRYDQIFFNWGPKSKDTFWKCASYWKEKNFEVYELEECDESEVEYWVFDGNGIQKHDPEHIDLFREAVGCSLKVGNVAFSCKVKQI